VTRRVIVRLYVVAIMRRGMMKMQYECVTHDGTYATPGTVVFDNFYDALQAATNTYANIVDCDARDAFHNGHSDKFTYTVEYHFETDQPFFRVSMNNDGDDVVIVEAKPA
jgi:hypothetical protein